ncbi:MAG: ABC transporter substrate-binding protein, partial [Candidatus Eisenbacteria bacterium]
IKEYVPGEKCVLARNPHYWEVDKAGSRLPYLDEYVFLIVKDLNTMALKFQSGETDLIDPIQGDQVPLFEDDQQKAGYKVWDMGPDVATDFMWFNLNPGKDAKGKPYVEPWKMKIFQDVRFRRAVSHAIDRAGIIKSVLQGRGTALYEPYSSANKTWFDPNVPKFPYDVAKSRALLDEMGLVDRNGDGIRDTPDGKSVEFTLLTNSENNLRKAFGTVIAENLKAVGIRVNFQPLEFNTLVTHLREDYQYEAILLGLASGVPPDPALSTNVYRSSGLTHNWYPKQKTPATPAEAEMDRLMNVVVQERDFDKRKAAFDRVQEIVGENQFCIYVVNRNLYLGLRNRVQGANPSVLRPHATWNVQELWLKGRGAPKLASH